MARCASRHPRKRTALGGGERSSLPSQTGEWLDNGAWRNDPPTRRSNGHHKPSAAEVAAGLAADAESRRWKGDGHETPLKPTKAGVDEVDSAGKGKVSATLLPSQQKVTELAELLDGMHADAQAMLKLDERLGMATSTSTANGSFKRLEKVIEHFEMTGGRADFKADTCRNSGTSVTRKAGGPRITMGRPMARWPG